MNGRQYNPSDHRRSHPHRQKRVNDVDEKHGPPDAFRRAPRLDEQHADYLHGQHQQNQQITNYPHVILMEAVSVAHHHQREDEHDRRGENQHEGELAHPSGAVEAQHHRAHQHQHGHQHRQAALVQAEEVALVESLQLLRLELLGPENLHHAVAARAHGKVHFRHELLLWFGLGSPVLQTQLHGFGSHFSISVPRGRSVVVAALLALFLPGGLGSEANPADGGRGSARLSLEVIVLSPATVGPYELFAGGSGRVWTSVRHGLRLAPSGSVLRPSPQSRSASAGWAHAVRSGHDLDYHIQQMNAGCELRRVSLPNEDFNTQERGSKGVGVQYSNKVAAKVSALNPLCLL